MPTISNKLSPYLRIGTCSWKFDSSSGNVSIIRLMGPDRQQIEKQTEGRWNRIVSAKDDSLESVARIVTGHIEQTRRTIVNVNNHYEGCAVLTIDRLIGMLDRSINKEQEH